LTVAFWILMQSMAAELVTALTVTPTLLMLHAAAGRGLLATASAATPINAVVPNRCRVRAVLAPAECFIAHTFENNEMSFELIEPHRSISDGLSPTQALSREIDRT
jgi:hypothetical protein